MNSLSWFLYLSDTLPSLSNTLSFFGALAAIVSAIGFAMTFLNTDSTREDNMARYARYQSTGRQLLSRAAPWAIGLFLIATVIPSSKTMYAIAASEVGEQVIKSEAVQGVANDATKALQQWIKRQIEPEKKS